jgi:hypothetical protein
VHAVFTVPPWLKFVLPGTVQITLLCTVCRFRRSRPLIPR